VPTDPGHGDDSVLEGLPERLQDGAGELRELVEKQQAAVCE
jgi:hypothetical protein